MSIEDVMLERYTRERQKGQGKKGMFNLEDEEDLAGFDEGETLGGLTHGGRDVSDLPGDDFDNQGLGGDDEEEDEDEREGRIHRRVVGKGHFGGFEEEEASAASYELTPGQEKDQIRSHGRDYCQEQRPQGEQPSKRPDARLRGKSKKTSTMICVTR